MKRPFSLLSLLLLAACAQPVDADGDGWFEDTDCADDDATVHPNADEACDGVDNDCDGSVDELGIDGSLWYTDADGDGFGDGATGTVSCEVETGGVSVAGDCNDADALVFPGAEELCDGADQDCDGVADEGATTLWYVDADGDGYGDDATATEAACEAPTGGVAMGGDCNDADASVMPGASDICDGLDNDCDGDVDGGVRVPTDFALLQDAVDAAEDGDVICVDEGVHTGHTFIDGRTLTIQGTGDPALVVLYGDYTGNPLLELHGSDMVFSGLTLSYGYAPFGSGMLVDRGTVSLTDFNIFSGSASGASGTRIGGALDMTDAAVTATNLKINGNYGGIGANEDGDATGVGFAVNGGTFDWIGGELIGNVLDNVTSDVPYGHYGYAMSGSPGGWVRGATVSITDVTISGNVGTWDITDREALVGGLPVGIVTAEQGATLNLTGVDFTANELTSAGSGVEIWQAPLTSYGNTTLNLDDVAFVGNLVDALDSVNSTYSAGAIFLYGPTLTGDGVTMTGNEAYVNTGSAATLVMYTSPTTLTHLDIRENIVAGYSVPSWGSIVNDVGSAPSFTNFVIADNELSMGAWIAYGPILAYGGTFSQGDITGNSTYGFGAMAGVVTLQGAATFTNVNLVNNALSDTGYGYYCWGGIVAFSYGDNTWGTFDHVNNYGNTGTRWASDRLDANCNEAALGATSSIAADPMYVDTTGATGSTWDLHLAAGSPAIDAGNPSFTDADASVSDIGAYGGASGSSW